jgi:16S rRNA (cytidine1402-2'-O)-methyltransferase
VIGRLEKGADIVLVSDAGTPALSDPGTAVVAAAHAAGHPVSAVPGPSAISAAVSVSGLPGTPFHFLGFPPRKKGALVRWLQDASRLPGTLVCFEAGRRLGGLFQVLSEHMGDRQVTICRELTKLHEEVTACSTSQLSGDPVPGEVVVVVGPGEPILTAATPVEMEGLKDLARVVSSRTGCTRSEAYRELVAMEERLSSSGED